MKTIKEYLNEGLIRHQAGMDMRAKIEAWLKKYNIKNYTINDDLTIDVDGDVDLIKYEEEQLPDYIQFGTVTKHFMLTESNVTSLRGCPVKIGLSFWCYDCPNLVSLEGAPQKGVKSFDCSYCPSLTSLKGCPQKIRGDFNCSVCANLTSLEGCPQEVGGDFQCDMCGGTIAGIFTEDDVKKVCKVKKDIIV